MFASFPRLAFLAGFVVAVVFGPPFAFAFAATLFTFAAGTGARVRRGRYGEADRRPFGQPLFSGPFGPPAGASFGRGAGRGLRDRPRPRAAGGAATR